MASKWSNKNQNSSYQGNFLWKEIYFDLARNSSYPSLSYPS